MDSKKAISAIQQAGALLVFPIDNKKEPASIWSAFFPRTPMRWEWDEDGDDRVGDLWHLRAELSTTRKVVYTKWFRGRATYLSRPIFSALLSALNPGDRSDSLLSLSALARTILRILDGESPLSPREIKRMADLKGKEHEAAYNRALKELWSRLLIVGYGEVDDGAFPSLAIGSTRVIYEDLWRESLEMNAQEAEERISACLQAENLFYRHFLKLKREPSATSAKSSPKRQRKNLSVVSFEDLHGRR